MTLEEMYGEVARLLTDMHDHMPTLRAYASKCQRVTEFGVCDCTSTWGLLAGRPAWMRSYDIVRKPEVDGVEALAAASGLDFKFILADTTQVEIEPCDLLFIDSYHSYKQMAEELRLHAGKVGRFMLMHDTVTFGHVDQDGERPSICEAIDEFLAAHKEWRTREVFTNCHGLTVLERI